ncbi:MAG TPA: FAD-dependent thymidylate synthase [Verrucomicrobiae bacterium]|jgi:thymidylate synthase ThyX|nr:FAD-dependent thymidylate synthase [Verrucomicrobiae bacterium]
MKVTQVAICPSEASKKAGRPALTPELLAASGARYSRNNEGLDSILSKIDPANLEKSVDSIFRMVDYGHQSIADMVPVALFIDGVSIWLAYYIWTLCPTAGGQESSTRYIKISAEGLVPPETLGIDAGEANEWRDLMSGCFQAYQSSLQIWEEAAKENPALMGIPRTLLEDSSEAASKKVARMRRNYAFDRARYFLPSSAATNLMLIMSARGWVNLCRHLLSHPLPEAVRAGELIARELEIPAPRMIKHARRTESVRQSILREMEKCVAMAAEKPANDGSSLSVMPPDGTSLEEISSALASHDNRYAPIGSALQRTAVRFGWAAISFAEIRDLNRHRTGTKYCPLVPRGFYFALDQVPPGKRAALEKLAPVGENATRMAVKRLMESNPKYIYLTLLGTEFPFEHLTTADKFIYEAELRTGLGAHFRYASHLRDVLALFYKQFPSTRGLILEGSAEPE